MSRKRLWAVSVLVAVFLWSTLMVVLGHAAAAAILLPPLVLLVQQFVPSLTTPDPSPLAGHSRSCPGEGQEAPQ
ncbi:hypothetical protein ABZX40_30085 [Streptomyces sp. NPDC004610]|uniref:hypothetical protein n=1 Tax=unclassified Streptomyces TaxID=2593676 RepID=UPI0033B8AB28